MRLAYTHSPNHPQTLNARVELLIEKYPLSFKSHPERERDRERVWCFDVSMLAGILIKSTRVRHSQGRKIELKVIKATFAAVYSTEHIQRMPIRFQNGNENSLVAK